MQKLQLNVWAATLAASAGIVYLLCVIFQPIFPAWAMYTSDHWPAMFPGFSWTLVGVIIGLVESIIYGAVAAVIFVPTYNYFSVRFGRKKS